MASSINKSTTMRLRVFTGNAPDGRETFANRSFTSVNPDITDDDLMVVGTAASGLLAEPVSKIVRENSAELIEG